MAKLYFRIILLFFAPALFIPVAAQDHNSAPVKPPEIAKTLQFIETKNRIGHEVQYEAAVHGGKLFLHPDKFTYAFYDLGDGHKHTDEAATGKKAHSREEKPRGHAYSVTFSGAHKATLKATGQTHGIYNYYLGNDQSKWVSGAKGYRQIDYDNLYPGIDMRLHEQGGKLKYEFFLEKGANPALIKMKYEGADKLEIRNGDLIVTTSINTVTEGRPYTYQIVNGVEKAVRCNFKVAGKEVSFELPDGYDQNLPLVIDPVLTYSTYSGSVADNWGYTATFDSVGNIYSGGIVFGGGFPVTTGSFDASFNGSNAMMHDIGILKYDPTQTGAASLVYATYIGGSGAESPHSLVVNNANELLILGSTGSSNYPVTSLAYSQLFKGGPSVTPLNLGTLNASHPNGVDIIISKLNSTGGSLLASTFLGGTDNDGVMVNANPLVKNYGDQFRGDIVVDASDNIFISSMTSSANFPIVDGFQPLYGGGATDAVVCMLSGDLSTILWSSFLGGSLADAAFSVQVASTGSVFVCGGTHSNNFPTAPGGHKPVYGNNGDGFVARISVTGDILEQSTYIGTSSYDQTYFVQLDQSENVYVLGQTLGTYPVTPGTYSEANAKQFIHALDYNLTNTVFSTTFGSANAQINISPTAFLVNECNRIYVAGWGGAINSPFSGYLGGFTTGMDTTSNATQPNTDGSDFYLMQLSQNAASLDFATFIGSPTVPEHVDGGTSRFDKRGNIYHAVCACGGILGNFPTTPGAWSETNASGNCNNAAFKYAIPELAADFIPSLIPNGPRETETCEPGTFYFRRVHSGGVTYLWDFGDSTTSNSPGPLSHSYAGPGNYIVTLTITDSSTCVITDMAVDTVHVLQASGSVSQNAIMCQPYAVQLEATGGSSYSWSPAAGLSDPFVSDPVASPDTTTTYTVNIGNSSGCIRTLMVEVVVIEEPVIVNFDSTGICRGQSTQLSATPGLGYVWTPNYALSSTTAANPIASPDSSVTYTVVVDAGLGCVYTKYVEVLVNSVPQIQAIGDANICGNDSVQLNVLADSANYSYQWSPAAGLSSDTVANPMANPPVSVTYYVTVTNSGNCQTTDSVQVSVIEAASIATQGPVSICETVPVQLSASPATGYAYTWSPDSTLSDGSISNPIATPSVTTTYYLTATAQNCTFTDSILVTVNAFPVVQMPADTSFCFGSSVMLNTIGSPQYSYQWSPGAGLSDSTIANPVANPLTSTWYFLNISTANCDITDSVFVMAIPYAGIATQSPQQICVGDTLQLESTANTGFMFSWSPAASLSNPAIPNPLAWPSATTTYYLASAGFGCTYNDTILVNVNAYPVVQMPADTAFCLGGSAILQPQVNQPYSYLWSPSTGLSDTTIRNPVASPSATTLYTLTTTLGGCPDTSYVTVTVKALPPADAGPDAALCPNKQVVLAAVPSSGSSYFWSPAAGLSSVTDSVVTASPSVTTTYYLAVTGANGCRAVDSVMVTAFVQPQLAATPEFPEGIAPYPLTFTNQSTGGTTYSWNFNNGTGSTELNPAANFPEPGVYEIVLTTSYGSGCLYSDTVARVTVVPPYVPNIITPNGDGVNDVFVAKVSNLPLHLQIFNRWGNLLFETDNYQHNWGGSDLPHGVYYYHLSTPDGGNWKGWLEIIR